MRTPLVLSLLALLLTQRRRWRGGGRPGTRAHLRGPHLRPALEFRTDLAGGEQPGVSTAPGTGARDPASAAWSPTPRRRAAMRLVQYSTRRAWRSTSPNGDPTSPVVRHHGPAGESIWSRAPAGGRCPVRRPHPGGRSSWPGDANDPGAHLCQLPGVTSLNNTNRAAKQLGGHVTSTINRAGQVGVDVTKGRTPRRRSSPITTSSATTSPARSGSS